MRISTKSRYAISALIFLAEKVNIDQNITIQSISESLGISKLYLEQIFSQLKRAKLVSSEKGAQGGYRLAMPTNIITIAQIMRLFESHLFEKTEASVSVEATYINHALDVCMWDPLDQSLLQILENTTLADLVKEAEKNKYGGTFMYYI